MKVVYLIKKIKNYWSWHFTNWTQCKTTTGPKRQLIPSNCVNMMLFPCGCINTLGKYWTHMSFVCFPSTYPRAVFLQPDLEGRARAAVQRITFSPVQEAADGLGRAPGSAAVAVQNVVFPGAFGRSISSRGDASTPVTAAGICQHGFTGRLCMLNVQVLRKRQRELCKEGPTCLRSREGLETGIGWGNEKLHILLYVRFLFRSTGLKLVSLYWMNKSYLKI